MMYLNKEADKKVYQTYITDALKAISDNTGRLVRDGVGMSKRFADLFVELHDGIEEAGNKQKAQEIISHMKSRLAKLGKEDS